MWAKGNITFPSLGANWNRRKCSKNEPTDWTQWRQKWSWWVIAVSLKWKAAQFLLWGARAQKLPVDCSLRAHISLPASAVACPAWSAGLVTQLIMGDGHPAYWRNLWKGNRHQFAAFYQPLFAQTGARAGYSRNGPHSLMWSIFDLALSNTTAVFVSPIPS